MAMTLSTQLSVASVASAVAILLVLITVSNVIYNLYFHPLRKFPGPFLHRATRLAFIRKQLRGTLALDVGALHEAYGPVVRIAPGDLSFIDPDAWKDIYGFRTGSLAGADEMPKHPLFYRTRGVPPNIISESRENHTVLRKAMSHGFSDRSMREQEPIIESYVALLMKRLRENCVEEVYSDDKPVESKPKPLDARAFFNWATFDIIGDLAFGEPFGCLEKWEYHPWVDIINKLLRSGPYVQTLKHLRLDFAIPVAEYLFRFRKNNTDRVTTLLERRMSRGEERSDFIEGLLKHKDEWNMKFDRLRSNATLLVIAGSETTATLLSGVTYLLCSNPAALEKLTAEVRSTFKSEDEITLTSVGGLTYMLACLNEALRRYPPVAVGLPRMVPEGGANIAGHFVPEKAAVSAWQWAMYHSTRNWEDPFSYKPERFLEGSKNPGDRLDSLQPFSVGPRNCIGKNLAYAEMRLIMARILFNFDMRLVKPEEDWMEQKIYNLWDKPPLNIYLTPVR